MINTEDNNNSVVNVCPVTGMNEKDMVTNFRNEFLRFEKDHVYPFSKYAKQTYPEVCIGDCTACKKWEQRTERDLYIRKNSTLFNRMIYELITLFVMFLFTLPITSIIGSIVFHRIWAGLALSFAIAISGKLFEHMLNLSPLSFESWLGEKFDKHISENKVK